MNAYVNARVLDADIDQYEKIDTPACKMKQVDRGAYSYERFLTEKQQGVCAPPESRSGQGYD